MAITNFPEVVGAIDGTHIRIVAPREYEAEFVNQKRYHSLNIQFAFDAQYKILDAVAKWPGSVRDASIWRECDLKEKSKSRVMPGGCVLIGHHGYPCQPWLLTPYLRPKTAAQEAYNRYTTAYILLDIIPVLVINILVNISYFCSFFFNLKVVLVSLSVLWPHLCK